MADEKQEFDVKVMLQSFDKAIESKTIIEAKHKIKLTQEETKDLAITFFIQSMKNIADNRKAKQSQYSY